MSGVVKVLTDPNTQRTCSPASDRESDSRDEADSVVKVTFYLGFCCVYQAKNQLLKNLGGR